ncbi:MAG: thiamine phosphate synthase [Alloprevotella sp.]
MKLILMTTPDFFVEEHQILNALFDEGLELLHLRKPYAEPVYSERLLSLIPETYRKRIVVHDHFYLKNEYKLRGIHLNSRNKELPKSYKGHISCSCHTLEEVSLRKKMCDYVFLSPVFDSISKEAYPSSFTTAQLREAAKQKVIDKKVMALGGVELDNIQQIKDLGFGGAVLLGAIWNRFNIHTTQDYKELVNHFRKLKRLAT